MDNMQLFSAPVNLDVDGALKLLEAVGLPMESGSVIAVKVDFTKPCPSCLPVLCDALSLCNPVDGSPRGCLVPGILQARTLEWVAISFSNA